MTTRIDAVLRDLKWAVRGLRRNPGFTAVALLTLALGLGANTAIYSVVHATLFRAPPVQEPDELVAVYTTSRRGFPRSSTSWLDFVDYRDQATLLEDLAATAVAPASLGDEARGARFVTVEAVSGNFFSLLGIDAWVGRPIGPDDDTYAAGRQVVVLSHELWSGHFGADPTLVGGTVRLNGTPFEVIGIMPPEYVGLRLDTRPDVWVPFHSIDVVRSQTDILARLEARGARWMAMSVGRMRDGATVEQVRDQFVQISEGLKQAFPDERGPRDTTVDALGSYALPNGAEADVSQLVWVLLGTVGVTLLLACANLANLLLARATSRKREIGVRLALGAERGHLIRQLLMESTLLSTVGGAIGLTFAVGLVRLLSGFELPGGVSIATLDAGLNGPVLLFTAVASVLTGVLFGIVPTLQASRPDLVETLKGDRPTSAGGGGRGVRRALVAVQVGLCTVLLIGSVLFVQTLREGMAHDLGFESDRVALARFNLGLLNYEPAEATGLLDDLQARLSARPGVVSATATSRIPLVPGGARGFFFTVPGYDPAPDEELRLDAVAVGVDYFPTLGIPLLEGRAPESSDISAEEPVVVINREMAEHYWPDVSPIGRTVDVFGTQVRVIGGAGNVTWSGLADDPTNFVYVPLGLVPDWAAGFVSVAVRTDGPAEGALGTLRTEIAALEPEASITELVTYGDQVADVLSAQQMGAALLTGFGLLAILLATLGIGGVVAFTVNEQRREIGIRLALGAERGRVMRLVARGMLLPVGAGLVVGILVARSLSASVESFLFGVTGTDLWTYATVAVSLLGIALIAALLPARRATRVDPLEVLNSD